jgi:hypothetical protein
MSVAKLELVAALVGGRLLNYFCKETGHDITKATLCSDSTVALGWIRNDPNNWKTFVANRVTEIQIYTTPSQWKLCPGEDNPADYLSRGVTAEQLKGLRKWWHASSCCCTIPSMATPENPNFISIAIRKDTDPRS